MTKPLLIGLVGPQASGKDTVAGFLADYHQFDWYRFADPLYVMLGEMLGMDAGELEDLKRADTPVEWAGPKATFRHLAQSLGTEWGRKMVHPDIWVRYFHHWQRDARDNQVLSDVRMQNEAAYIKEQGGTLVGIERPGAAWKNDHASEFGHLIRTDIIIHNDKDLPALRDTVAGLVDWLRNQP